MNDDEVQKTWDEYHERIKARRISEAKAINIELEKNLITSETDLILDFTFFTKDEGGAKGLKNQLSENYELSTRKDGDSWIVDGTSRPYAVNLTSEQHLGWVEFMHDVALSHGCIFSVWSVTDAKTKRVWSSESIDSATN